MSARRVRGLSLIELMVGLVVCLLVSLAAAKSAQMFSAVQRQGVTTGAGRSNAQSALAAIKEDVATGGVGFFANGSYRCTKLNMSVGNDVLANNASFFPVQATRVNGNDRLDVVYANDVTAGAWTELKEVSNGSSATLTSMMPMVAGQQPAVLLARKDSGLGSPCLVRSVTDFADPTDSAKQTLTFGAAGNHNKGVFTVTPDFEERDPIVMLGRVNWNRYELQGTNLVLIRRLSNTTATLLPNVIAFRVQYGVTTGGSAVDGWQNADAAGWTVINEVNARQIRAIRLGLIIRAAQREKEDAVSHQCTAVPASQAGIVLFSDTPTPVAITPPGDDWRCFHYRTVEMVAPLRNLVSGTAGFNWPQTTLVAP